MYSADVKGDSFLKDGDKWLFIGDSITNIDTYRKVVLRVLQHYHPDADIIVGNSAVNGVTADYIEKREFTPTVVTIMLGMNDVIHQDWSFVPDIKPKIEAYRKSITKKVRKYKKLGAEVVLMTPTYTDERIPTYFNVAMTKRFLEAFGKVTREIAMSEKCHWIPVAEELEAFQNSLATNQFIRPDGVHPYGLGQYQIARSLIEHLNLAGNLTGKRKLHTRRQSLNVSVHLKSRFMNNPEDGIALTLSTQHATKVNAKWSLASESGEAELRLSKKEMVWTINVSPQALTLDVGRYRQLVIELSSGNKSKLLIIDLARTKVLHLKNGIVEGELTTNKTRPEGKTVSTWKIEEKEGALWFSGEVFDSINTWNPGWPFLRDGVQLWLDWRPKERFAGINPDRDVSDIIITVQEKPFFSVTPVHWIAQRLMYGSMCGGSKTSSGYRWHYGIGGRVTDRLTFDIRKYDYFGFNMLVCDNDTKNQEGVNYYKLMDPQVNDQLKRLNLLMIIDRKNIFPNSETTNLHLFK
jgi:lysophospholipase L1-like esterase